MKETKKDVAIAFLKEKKKAGLSDPNYREYCEAIKKKSQILANPYFYQLRKMINGKNGSHSRLAKTDEYAPVLDLLKRKPNATHLDCENEKIDISNSTFSRIKKNPGKYEAIEKRPYNKRPKGRLMMILGEISCEGKPKGFIEGVVAAVECIEGAKKLGFEAREYSNPQTLEIREANH